MKLAGTCHLSFESNRAEEPHRLLNITFHTLILNTNEISARGYPLTQTRLDRNGLLGNRSVRAQLIYLE